MAKARAQDPNLDPAVDSLTDKQADALASDGGTDEPTDVKKGQLTGNVVKNGVVYPRGTKASELDLSDEEKARLERLDLIA